MAANKSISFVVVISKLIVIKAKLISLHILQSFSGSWFVKIKYIQYCVPLQARLTTFTKIVKIVKYKNGGFPLCIFSSL